MATINMGSITSKMDSYLKTNTGALSAATSAEGRAIAAEAGSKLVRCIEDAIAYSGMSGGAIAAVGEVSSTLPVEVDAKNGVFEVYVSIGRESRLSLDPDTYGGVFDMAALLNNGYDTEGRRVRGLWHGKYIWSNPFRDGAHFVEIGVNNFNSAYGSTYNAVATIEGDRFK